MTKKANGNDRPENIKRSSFHYYHDRPFLTSVHWKYRQGDTLICLPGVNVINMVILISGSFHMDNHIVKLCVFMVCLCGIRIANTLYYY